MLDRKYGSPADKLCHRFYKFIVKLLLICGSK